MKKNMKPKTFSSRLMTPGKGPPQPPRKSVAARAEITIMFAYSAMKKRAYFIEEYSVQKPETSSVSASGRSKGVRLISASEQMTKSPKASGWEKTYQLGRKAMLP